MNCIVCNEVIPEGRIKALPNTKVCVDHSTTERYGCFNVSNHKTGNKVQVIKDINLAMKINDMAKRMNYGVQKGVRMAYK